MLALKRIVDVAGAGLAAFLLGPVIGAAAVAVRLRIGQPVIFKQTRPGLYGAEFTLYKFRTMSDDRDADGALLADAERLTPLGSTLRRWSLDELPELWNVVRGDMSLVGPRPLLMGYLSLYSEEQMRRHEMRPGLTGLAQASGRNAQTWDERLDLDVWYVDHWSLWLDAKILARTVVKVLTREGISATGHATMPLFEGSNAGGSDSPPDSLGALD